MPADAYKPFIYDETTGKQRLLRAGENLDVPLDSTIMTAGAAITIGQAVSANGSSEVVPTDALSAALSCSWVGIACETVAAAASVPVVTSGTITLTTGEWDAITGGTGGLTPGASYWVDDTTPGNLTTTPLVSSGTPRYVVKVGVAINSTQMTLVTANEAFGI